MTDETYQGWTNRETWLVNLWLNNEFSTYQDCCELARQHVEVEDIADAIGGYVDELQSGTFDRLKGAGFMHDLVGAALDRVNWTEIAAAFLSSVVEA